MTRISLARDLWVALGVSSAAATVFSLLVLMFAPVDFWEWMTTLVGTVISFLLAAGIGTQLYVRQRKFVDSKYKGDLRRSLRVLANDCIRLLEGGQPFNVTLSSGVHSAVLTNIQSWAILRALESHLFDESEVDLLIRLLRDIELYSFNINCLFQVMTGFAIPLQQQNPAFEGNVINTIQNVNASTANIIARCTELLECI